VASASAVARRRAAILAVVVSLVGMLAGLALPFAPVIAGQTAVTWPVAGQPVVSTTAMFVPYRPAELTATVPCRAIRVAADRGGAVTVLATGRDGDGLVLTTGAAGTELLVDHHREMLAVPDAGVGCRITVHAAFDGITISGGGAPMISLPGEPVPKVFAFHTDLDPAQAEGITVAARTASPFATRPATIKILLIVGQLVAVVTALGVLIRVGRRADALTHAANRPARTPLGWRAAWVDTAVIAVLASWAVIGPLAVDDGWATMIARNYAATGNAGNYYRWWNASETPFAFSQQLLAPLTHLSLAPLWLRLPSTLLAVATWFVLSRGVLFAALPTLAGVMRVRLLAALCLLAAWLPYNLGARPESYVALGATSVLALLWQARGPAAVGWAALIAGLTVPISPTSVVLAAPVMVFAPRVIAILRKSAPGRLGLLSQLLLLGCIGAVGMTVIFADQTWDGLIAATNWHRFFGPSLPWYHEPDRYRYLLGDGQQGSFAKRLPVLLTIALLPIVGALFARRTQRSDDLRSAARLAAVVLTALFLLSLVPSKWSYHLGALAGVFASFLAVAVVLVTQGRTRIDEPITGVTAVLGAGLVAAAASVAFAGPNAWWLPAIYDVPWASGPVRPKMVPLNSVLLWIGVLVVGYALAVAWPVRHRARRVRHALIAGPAMLTVIAAGTALAVMLASFMAAPLRRQSGSLAVANLRWLAGRSTCGLADDIAVLQDGDPLPRASPSGELAGFTALAGFPPDRPPPDPPGTGMSTELWGSFVAGPAATATMTSPWFTLPPSGSADGLSVSVSGRTDGSNRFVFEFGLADATRQLGDDADAVTTVADFAPPDRGPPGEDPVHFPWRSIAIDAAKFPAGANRVRIRALDARADPAGWLAFTGPRSYSVIGLTEFLARHGPVLVSWPQSFLFPCVHNIARVADGIAQAPRAVIVAPGPWFTAPTDQSLGGDFAALVPFGRLYQIATRLAGHPDIDWGTLLISADTSARDAYQLRKSGVARAGHTDSARVYQTQLPR
jgi:arabinosyltransferase B